jgi:hypothetical protein
MKNGLRQGNLKTNEADNGAFFVVLFLTNGAHL